MLRGLILVLWTSFVVCCRKDGAKATLIRQISVFCLRRVPARIAQKFIGRSVLSVFERKIAP